MINNMKIVHESEVRKLKAQIEELKKELIKETSSSGIGSRKRWVNRAYDIYTDLFLWLEAGLSMKTKRIMSRDRVLEIAGRSRIAVNFQKYYPLPYLVTITTQNFQ